VSRRHISPMDLRDRRVDALQKMRIARDALIHQP
jgi:hypothetical protein